MTQEDKNLLLRDLSARLPYGVKGIITYNGNKGVFTLIGTYNTDLYLSDNEACHIEDFKPYLRPMSSMTDEERKIYIEISSHLCGEIAAKTMIDWLNANHFDYRGLIEKGLAIAVTEENNPYKE